MLDQKQVRLVWWDGIPLALVVLCFVGLALANWDYESTFFQPILGDNGEADYYLGPNVLAFGCIFALVSSTCFLLAREARSDRGPGGRAPWWRVIWLGFISLIFFILSMSIITIGPEALIESQDQFPQGASH